MPLNKKQAGALKRKKKTANQQFGVIFVIAGPCKKGWRYVQSFTFAQEAQALALFEKLQGKRKCCRKWTHGDVGYYCRGL